jgi:hypothetical protein
MRWRAVLVAITLLGSGCADEQAEPSARGSAGAGTSADPAVDYCATAAELATTYDGPIGSLGDRARADFRRWAGEAPEQLADD